ncbi:hypothetical protein A2U01_0027620, partial [Trifolium medium]|nr:hypothetical protein [Trifolium medium]
GEQGDALFKRAELKLATSEHKQVLYRKWMRKRRKLTRKLIIAVIKSCTLNGFGDMTVTLKVLFHSFQLMINLTI